MSKILRRPMFRGGAVDSRGTGITSGLMDTPKYATGGRVGYQEAGVVTGGDLISKGNIPIDLSALANTRFSAGVPFSYELTPIKDKVEEAVEETETDDRGILQKFYDMFNPSKETIEDRLKKQDEGMTTFDEKMENIGIITNKQKQKIAADAAEKAAVGGREDPDIENARIQQENYEKNLNQINTDAITGNQEQTTEIDPKQLMKENAELFKELLGEGNKKKLKDARIGDVSDYLLKFFEGTQKEGATVGSAAADVAAFATARPSKTEQAKAAIEKQDQTAIALAINDYVAGKRSKEQLDALIAKSDLALSNKKAAIDYANKLTQGFSALPGFIADSKAIGYASQVIDGLRKSGLSQLPIERVTSTEMAENFEFNPETDTGTIFIETDTKTTYTFNSDGTKRILDQG